jgi:hypothetical protein
METRENAIAALDDYATQGNDRMEYCELCSQAWRCGAYHELGDHFTPDNQE